MLSYEILDGFVFAFVQFNCWIHVLILCFLGLAICALCHRSCLHARVVGGHFPICFLYLFISFLRSLLVIISLSLSRLSSCCFWFFLFAVSRVSVALIGWCIWHFRVKCQFAYHSAIVYCLLRNSLDCLNWLVYMALLDKVSIG